MSQAAPQHKSRFAHARKRLRYPNARFRMLVSAALALLSAFLMPAAIRPMTRTLASWDIGAICFLGMAFLVMTGSDEKETYRTASQQDQSGAVILAVVVGCAGASLFVIGHLLGRAREISGWHRELSLLVSALTIVCSWLLTHTMFALHYAHRYYGGEREEPVGEVDKGLAFPGEGEPSYVDFLYFAFGIGMTAQVSDVQATTRRMRMLILMHSVLSFWFYAGILALAINLVSGLIGGG